MRIEKYYQREIENFTWDAKNKSFQLLAKYRGLLYNYVIPLEKLKEADLDLIKRFQDGTHHLFIIIDEKSAFVKFKVSKRIAKKGISINKFERREYIPIDYIKYHQYGLYTQLDGITTIVGMSGAGKTYSALHMLPSYALYFDKIAYLNYELTDRDISKRLEEIHPNIRVQEEVYRRLYIKEGIMTSLDLEEILYDMDVIPNDRVAFIVDNVGSVVGQEDNVYQKQNEFLKHLDVICKERGFHALALTQTVKDHNMKLFDDNGDVIDSVNMSIMAGSIMLGNLSRSVLFTGFNGKLNQFKTKILKKGTGLLYSDEGIDLDEIFIRK